MPYRVCLTGGIGSGKTTVAQLFADLGVTVIDADAIAHALTGPGGAAMRAIREAFGTAVIRDDGALDRTRMRTFAFGDPAARARLEAILHPLIRRESEAQVAAARSRYVLLVIPLLLESGRDPHDRCERVLVVDCPEETQIARVTARSGLAREEVERIMSAQVTRQARLAAADDVIDNDGDGTALAPQVRALHRRYLDAASSVGDANRTRPRSDRD